MMGEIPLSELARRCATEFSTKELCRLTDAQHQEYLRLLSALKTLNASHASDTKKGAILEELVSYLLKISGNIFNVYRNIHTKTNEIDQFITLNDTGKLLAGLKMLPCRFESFLGECKNYRNKSDVTHIGKFYSLLMSTSIKTGILFTYHGVTGSGWNDGTGLIKKMYLQRELDDNRVAIIVFSIQDYERIAAGENFIDLFNRKLLDLRLDTSIDTYVSPHEAELQLNQLSLSDQQE